ncbi:MAG: hypothetical protein PHQ60_02870 [Sideroxydans sp.]|nr:hypothetical protein [Sideroxydans sp.]
MSLSGFGYCAFGGAFQHALPVGLNGVRIMPESVSFAKRLSLIHAKPIDTGISINRIARIAY